MKAFLRAVLLSLRYKWTIAGSILCSLLIAFLWSASISTVFPVVKIVIEGETAQSWVAKEIKDSRHQCQRLADEIKEQEKQLAKADAVARKAIENKLDLNRSRLKAEQQGLARFEYFQPIVERYLPKSAFQTLVITMVWLLIVAVLKGGLLVISVLLVSRVANRTVMDLRRIYYRKALELDQRRIDRMGTSNMMTHLSYNMQMVSSGLAIFYGKMVREPLKMLVCLSVAAYISLPLLMLSLVVVPAGAWVMHSISRRMKRSAQRELQGMADVFQTLIETFKAIKTVRIFNRECAERRRFKKNTETLYRMSLRISLYDSLLRPISEVLGIVSIALSILAGAYLVLNKEIFLFGIQMSSKPIDPSLFVLFYTMLGGATDPARKMSEIINVLARGGMACENLFKAYDVESSVAVPEQPVPVPLHRESIEFQDVLFAYQSRQTVLRQVNLNVPFGQTVAIVGGNGSGKSTLMNLLARFYDANSGRILLDGVDISQMNPKKLRQQISWVTQDSVLFKGTIWENIAYGARDASEQQILAAAQLAGVDSFARQMKKGYQTDVGDEGRQLSAGQRQRVALARAVVSDPRILILDEATSQMDGQTESIVHEALRPFLRARTSFLITHRVSSLHLADRVIVMDSGRIIHDGTLEEAYQHSPQFQFLFERKSA